MVLGAFFFAAMAVCIKFASAHYNTFEIVTYRGLIGLLLIWAVARAQRISLATTVPMMHLWRGVVGVTSQVCWFYSMAVLPLPTAMTLNYMSSIWIAAFLIGGTLLLQRSAAPLRQQSPLYLTVVTGFAGVALVLQPSFNGQQAMGGLIGLMSGLFAALAFLQVAALSRAGEPETRTVYYFSICATCTGLAGASITGFSPLLWPSVLWLLPVGVLAALGQLCLTRAYSSGATLLVANLQYSGIVFASLFDVVFFNDTLPWFSWLGVLLIIGCGIGATALRSRAIPQAPAEEHS